MNATEGTEHQFCTCTHPLADHVAGRHFGDESGEPIQPGGGACKRCVCPFFEAGPVPVPLKEDNRPPNQMRHGAGKSRGDADEVLIDLDDSLDASHKRMRFALAVQTRRIELSARKGGLTTGEIELLDVLSRAWRTLVMNAPPPDLSDLSTEQLEAQLAAVKERAAK